MKRLSFALGAATLLLATSTHYLAHELKLERARTAQASVVAQSAPPDRAAPVTPPLVPEAAPTPEAAQTTAPPQQPAQLRREPVVDTVRVAEIKAAFAPMMKDMMAYAGLSTQESELLLDLTAEAMVRGQALGLECKSTPGCDFRATQKTAQESLQRELERMLGADKMQRLHTYDELQRVRNFRSQLPAGQTLSETTATQLGTELADERSRRVDKTETASAFSQRMYDRAAGILTAEQLAFFKQRQESTFGRD